MVRDKFRIRFRKAGDLRLVSHHDLMRTFERMLRRAALPYHSTAGFNPKPRLVFALSLGLGIVGLEEVAELEMDDELPSDEVGSRLRAQAPPGLEILEVRRVSPRVGAQVSQVTYRIALPPDAPADLPERVVSLVTAAHAWVERTRPQPKRLDLRPYLLHLRLSAEAIEMDLRVTPNGTARPDEILTLLGLGDWLAAGGVLERTRIELDDENQVPAPEYQVPEPRAESRPLPLDASGADLRPAKGNP